MQETIAQATKKSGRSPDDVQLVAVSKTHPAEKVQAAAEAGQILFGESRVQEARAKIPLLPSRLRWHFIGHLQKNKIRHALPLFELFHGIDSLALAQDMQRIAEEEGIRPRVLLEVNLAGEASKHGFSPEAVRRDLEAILSLGRLTVEGLMTIPPLAPEAEGSRRYFLGVARVEGRAGGRIPGRLAATLDGDERRLSRSRSKKGRRWCALARRSSANAAGARRSRTVWPPMSVCHLFFATRNGHKTRELAQILGPAFALQDLRAHPEISDVIEDGATFAENARIKATTVSRQLPGSGAGGRFRAGR